MRTIACGVSARVPRAVWSNSESATPRLLHLLLGIGRSAKWTDAHEILIRIPSSLSPIASAAMPVAALALQLRLERRPQFLFRNLLVAIRVHLVEVERAR